MKRSGFILILAFASTLASAQVMFRNDFTIGRKSWRLKNKGLTYVTFNMGSRHSWNLNAYGQPAKSFVIDVKAIRVRREYSYQEVAEKIYRPGAVYRREATPIPLFLLFQPPAKIKVKPYSYFARNRRSDS